MRYILILILLCCFTTTFSQPTFSDFYRVDSAETINTTFHDILVQEDGFYLSGSQRPYLSFPDEAMMMKLDTNGQILWVKGSDTIQDIQWKYGNILNTDKGYLAMVGRRYDRRSSLIFINFNGEIIHIKDYSVAGQENYLFLAGVEQDDANNFYLHGIYNPNPYESHPILIKTDSLGTEIWRRTYNPTPYEGSGAAHIIKSNRNTLLLLNNVGFSADWDLQYKKGVWIIEVDTMGNTINEYESPYGTRWIGGYQLIETKDGGMVFSGTDAIQISNSTTADFKYAGYAAKLDSNFQLQWEKSFGGYYYSSLQRVKEKENGDLLLTGNYVHNFLPDSVQYSGWLLALDADGDSLWQRTYHDLYDAAYPFHIITDVEQLDDGDLLMAGYMNNIRANSLKVGEWGWLIRTDSFGCIVPGCQLLDNTENISVFFDNEVVVFPNPASEVVRFRFEKAINKNTEIRVYSGLGQLVGETNVNYSNEAKMNVSDWNSGVYYYGIYVEGRLVKQGQILKQ